MGNVLSRRKLITSSLAAAASASGLGVAAFLASRYGLIPPDHGGIYGIGKTITYASQRLLISQHSLAREFNRSEISKFAPVVGEPPTDETYKQLSANSFRDWRLKIDGLVTRPSSFSLEELKRFPSRSQITNHICEQGTDFANAAVEMCTKNPDISLHAIIVNKENVESHIRKDPNKLYNFMVKMSLLDCLGGYDNSTLVPDARSMKVESGNSLHDYLQIELWFTKKVKTILTTTPLESKHCLGIQFADMLSGIVQSCVENRGERDRADFKIIEAVLKPKFLFFKVSKTVAGSVAK